MEPEASKVFALHARRTHGSVASCGKTRLSRRSTELANSSQRKTTLTVTAFFADLRKRQTALGGRLVPQKKKAEPTAEADRGRDSGSPESTSSDAAPAA